MPRLARLRLVSIGHPQARMDDLILDLCDPAGVAMDSTLWLRNGGGKSSVLNLFFALVRPDRREFLGGKAEAKKRRLEDYVLQDDRAVVACEWEVDSAFAQPALQGLSSHLVTGSFYEWRSGAASDDSRLRRLFFAARTDSREPRLHLESLPLFVMQGERRTRRTLAAFRQEWHAMREQYPHLQFIQTENHREWADYLDAAGIDPELFAYQVRMNQREGGVDEIFRFDEHEQFVDFLIELVLDPALGDRVSRNIATFRRELKERKDRLIPERELLAGLASRLAPMHDFASRRGVLVRGAAHCSHALKELSQWISARLGSLNAAADVFEQRRVKEALAAEAQRQSFSEHVRRAAALRMFAARRHLADATEKEARLRRGMQDAAEQYQIWDAVVPLRNARRFEAQAELYAKELERKRTEQAPLLADLQSAADALAQALGYRRSSLRANAAKAAEAETSAREEARQARTFAADCGARVARATTEAERFESLIRTSTGERERLEKQKVLHPQETGTGALAQLGPAVEANVMLMSSLTQATAHLRASQQLRRDEREAANVGATQARARAAQLNAQLEEAESARRKLEDSATLQRALEVEAVDIERVTDESLVPLKELARQALEGLIQIAIDRADDEHAAATLAETGLLPPTRDAERVLEQLKRRLQVAWTGWSYIEANVPAAEGRRQAVAQRQPELALGVIVRDADFERARDILNAAQAPSTPVVVAPQSAFAVDSADGVSSKRFVIGPASNAYFDRASAQTELLRRRAQLDEYHCQERRLQDDRAELESLLTRLQEFRGRFPRGWFVEQRHRIDVEHQHAEDHTARADLLHAEISRLEADIETAIARRTALESVLAIQHKHLALLEEYVRQHELPLEAWHAGLRRERAEAIRQKEEAGRWIEEASLAEGRATGFADLVRQHGENARAIEEELHGVQYLEGGTTEAAGPIEERRDRYRQLKSMYEMNVGAEGLLQLQNMAASNAADERTKLAPKLSLTITPERVFDALHTLEDPVLADARREEANEAKQFAQGVLGAHTHVLTNAGTRVREAEELCTSIGDVPTLPPAELPPGPIQAETEADAIDSIAASEKSSAETHDRAAADAAAERDNSRRLAALLGKDQERADGIAENYADLLGSLSGSPSEPFVVPADDTAVPEAVRAIESNLKGIRADLSRLNDERRDATKSLRDFSADSRFAGLKSTVARQIADASDDELEAHASAWHSQLGLRIQHIEAQLVEMNRHREILIGEVLAAAEEGVALLKSAANQSRLPQNVPGLGGQQFLRITSHEPAELNERRGRIGMLIDELLDEDNLPTGLALVQRSVARFAKPIRVKVLNPDPDLGGVSVDITDMARFSGGEQLTGAILLYCTLAQLRARSRGTLRQSASVLILDNPIGRASRVRFLELQREVAKAMGVQLFYTTAVNDHEALRTLPNLIRLRNQRFDRNRGHRLLEAETEVPVLQSVRIGRSPSPQLSDAH